MECLIGKINIFEMNVTSSEILIPVESREAIEFLSAFVFDSQF